MERTLAAATARDVGLVVPLTEAGSTLSYNLSNKHSISNEIPENSGDVFSS